MSRCLSKVLVFLKKEGGNASVGRVMMEIERLSTIQELFEKTCLTTFYDQEGESMFRSGLFSVSFYGELTTSLQFFCNIN